MSIEEIKDIKKLQKRLKSALDELRYIKKCCEDAGLELAKHSFSYDHKEKNLVIQALQLNEDFERRDKALNEILGFINRSSCNVCTAETSKACIECNFKRIKDIIDEANYKHLQ